MRKPAFLLACLLSLPALSRATDVALPPSIGPVYMVVERIGTEFSKNLGLVLVRIPNESHRYFYGSKTTTDKGPETVYLGIDLASNAGSLMYDDFRRAFAAGDTLVVRCRMAPSATTYTIKNDQPQEPEPKQLEKFPYWIPELVWNIPN